MTLCHCTTCPIQAGVEKDIPEPGLTCRKHANLQRLKESNTLRHGNEKFLSKHFEDTSNRWH